MSKNCLKYRNHALKTIMHLLIRICVLYMIQFVKIWYKSWFLSCRLWKRSIKRNKTELVMLSNHGYTIIIPQLPNRGRFPEDNWSVILSGNRTTYTLGNGPLILWYSDHFYSGIRKTYTLGNGPFLLWDPDHLYSGIRTTFTIGSGTWETD